MLINAQIINALETVGFSKRQHELILDVSAKLESFCQQLFQINQKNSFVSEKNIEDICEKHIVDSIFVEASLPSAQAIIDIGTGPGLPGIVLAILRPTTNFYLVEPRKKHFGFLKEMRRVLKLNNVQLLNSPIEQLIPEKVLESLSDPSFSYFAVSRAFSPLSELLRLSKNWICSPACLYFVGGENLNLDLKAATLVDKIQYHPIHLAKTIYKIAL